MQHELIYESFSEKEWALLKNRAKRLQQSSELDEVHDLTDVLMLQINKERYALPVSAVLACYERVPTTPLPGTPDHIVGVANIRGHLTTVLDLAAILGLGTHTEMERSSLVVLDTGTSHCAFVVSRVLDVLQIEHKSLMPVSLSKQKEQARYLAGVLPDKTIMLDYERIINDPQLIVS